MQSQGKSRIVRQQTLAVACAAVLVVSACGGKLETAEPEVPLSLDAPPARRAFKASEGRLKAYMASSIEGHLADVPQKQRRLARKANGLKNEFKRIWGGGGGSVNVAALCRVGLIYDHYVRASLAAYRSAPVPAQVEGRGEEAVRGHKEGLSQLARTRLLPIIQRASKWYQTCLKYALDYHVSADYAREASIRLRSLSRINFVVR